MISPIAAFIIQEAAQYGPELVASIVAALRKPETTIADIETIFAGVKKYEDYGIPAVAPTQPQPVAAN